MKVTHIPVFLRRFRDLIRDPRIRENYYRVPRIREIGSLQIHTRYLTFSLKKTCIYYSNVSGFSNAHEHIAQFYECIRHVTYIIFTLLFIKCICSYLIISNCNKSFLAYNRLPFEEVHISTSCTQCFPLPDSECFYCSYPTILSSSPWINSQKRDICQIYCTQNRTSKEIPVM